MTNGVTKIEHSTWEPFRELMDIRNSFDQFFGRSLAKKDDPARSQWVRSPRIEMVDRKDHLLVRAEVPGVDKKDIKLEVQDGYLVLSGETQSAQESKEGGVYYSERSAGSFYRSIELPENLDEKNIKASYKDGVLSVTLPKKEKPAEHRKTIAIE